MIRHDMIRHDVRSTVSREQTCSRSSAKSLSLAGPPLPGLREAPPAIATAQIPGKGRGVVAQRPFQAGETIERPPVIVIPREEVATLRQTRLASYYYEWGADCRQAAVALGCGSLYNHSYEPNARFVFHEDEECLEFISLRDIEPGEEITINYNNLEESAALPMTFDVQH